MASKKKGHLGLHVHRFKENPEEKKFAEAWEDQNKHGKNLAYLLDQSGSNMPSSPSVRDEVVAATVIQWLGSPVGQAFLRDLGYVNLDPPKKTSKKGCKCFDEIDKLLKERNGSLVGAIRLRGEPVRAYVAIQKFDEASRVKPGFLAANYCPFCGEKYPE